MPGCNGRTLTEDEKNAIKWEARPVIYMTLSLDPKYILTREALLERLDTELEAMRRGAIAAWDNLPDAP